MANTVKHDEAAIEADETARTAAVIAALIRSGALQWSTVSGAPVTGRRDDKLTADVEEWLRHG